MVKARRKRMVKYDLFIGGKYISSHIGDYWSILPRLREQYRHGGYMGCTPILDLRPAKDD